MTLASTDSGAVGSAAFPVTYPLSVRQYLHST